jgi:hypothetical protein
MQAKGTEPGKAVYIFGPSLALSSARKSIQVTGIKGKIQGSRESSHPISATKFHTAYQKGLPWGLVKNTACIEKEETKHINTRNDAIIGYQHAI